MKQIPFAVGQASGIAIMPVNADATNTNTSGGASVFAGLVISAVASGVVLRVTANNYQSVLGAAIHPRQGAMFEPLRHVERATKGGDGYVVRVCAPDMKIPTLALTLNAETKAFTTTASTMNVGALLPCLMALTR